MTIQAGKDILLKLSDGGDPPDFVAVAGLRMKTISLNAKPVDVTHADSPEGWREYLSGAGLKTCTISGAGVFLDGEADARIRQSFFDQSVLDWQVFIPDFGRIDGRFLVAALDYSGRHDGEAAWSMTLSSAGQLSFEVS